MNKLIVFLLLSIVLYSQEANNNEENIINTLRTNKAYLNERDKLTSKLNIFTSWKNSYKYLRDNKFRFYKRYGRSLTLEFKYKNPYMLSVTNSTPIVFMFENGGTVQLTNIQYTVYNPYMMGKLKYYEIEVHYKFNADSDFSTFANSPITNIRFNFINYLNTEEFDDISFSSSVSSNWQSNFNLFYEGVEQLDSLTNNNTATTNNN